MPTSTLIAYATQSTNYSWDSATGFLFSAGGLVFFVVILIITGVINLGASGLKSLLGFTR